MSEIGICVDIEEVLRFNIMDEALIMKIFTIGEKTYCEY